MTTWRDVWEQDFLEEMMWGEGLRYVHDDTCCSTCGIRYEPPPPERTDSSAASSTTPPRTPVADDDDPPLPSLDPPRPVGVSEIYCCWECGDFLQCRACCLKRHQTMPLHIIQVSWYCCRPDSVCRARCSHVVRHGPVHTGRRSASRKWV